MRPILVRLENVRFDYFTLWGLTGVVKHPMSGDYKTLGLFSILNEPLMRPPLVRLENIGLYLVGNYWGGEAPHVRRLQNVRLV